MNIMIFSPTPSHPQNHGNRKRVFNLARHLQQLGHRIHFVYFARQKRVSKEALEEMQRAWDTLTLIKWTTPCPPSSTGYPLDAWYQENIHRIVNELIDIFDIKIVLLNYIFQSKMFEELPRHVLKVIDTHDSFTDRHLIYQGKGNYTWFSVSAADEGRALDRADTIIAIQNKEAAYFSKITNTPVCVINHLEEKHTINRNYHRVKTVGFIGSNNLININSINKFLTIYLNRQKINDDIRIVVAGDVCKKITLRHNNLTLSGFNDILDNFYSQVDLVINPQISGTGLKIKTVEALAYGVPIISTKIGFEGIESNHPYHQLDTPGEIADAIDRTYEKPEMLDELARASKAIFDTYESNVRRAVKLLLDRAVENPMESIENLKHQLERKEAIITCLYRKLQTDSVINSHRMSNIYGNKWIKEVVNANNIKGFLQLLRHHPLCEQMLTIYHWIKR